LRGWDRVWGKGNPEVAPGVLCPLISQYLRDNAVEKQFRVKLPFEAAKQQFVFSFESEDTERYPWAISGYISIDTRKKKKKTKNRRSSGLIKTYHPPRLFDVTCDVMESHERLGSSAAIPTIDLIDPLSNSQANQKLFPSGKHLVLFPRGLLLNPDLLILTPSVQHNLLVFSGDNNPRHNRYCPLLLKLESRLSIRCVV